MTDDAMIRAIAREVAQILKPQQVPELMTAREVAALLGVDPTWVYENADDLGVIRIGKGKRPRLRFDRAVIAERLTPRPRSRFARKPSPPPAPGVSLLPIKPRPRHNHREE